jgi:ribonuclease-3
VANHTLAQLSAAYSLQTRMIASHAQLPSLKLGTRTLANLFEAHVAAVYFDYWTSEPAAPHPPLERTQGGAFDALLAWLAPLFDPLVCDLHSKLDPTPAPEDGDGGQDDTAAHGAPMLLNEFMTQRTGQPASYVFDPAVGGWECTCSASLGGTEYAASAVRDTKKNAKTVAAHAVVKDMGLDGPGGRGRYLNTQHV